MGVFTPTQLRFTVNTININPRDLKGTSIKELKLGTGMWEWTPAAGSFGSTQEWQWISTVNWDSESLLLTKCIKHITKKNQRAFNY